VPRSTRGEPLVQISGLGVHPRLSRPAYNDIAEQRHPTSGTEHVVRSPPADRRVDPVPRRRRDEDIEASTTVVPLLERRRLDVDVGEAADSMAGECGHLRPGSMAVTEHPSAANERVAWPVPQPTSSTDDLWSMPVTVTRAENISSGYLGWTWS
jgi:hypothetical protein